jgi:ATP-dependent RNA helicase DHX8/PRP22
MSNDLKGRVCLLTMLSFSSHASGKSTQIPQYIADDFYSYRGEVDDLPVRICCTQPRRLAAQLLAERVATEYKTSVGNLVGFKVGSRGRAKEDCVKIGKNTIIEFVTEGRQLLYEINC